MPEVEDRQVLKPPAITNNLPKQFMEGALCHVLGHYELRCTPETTTAVRLLLNQINFPPAGSAFLAYAQSPREGEQINGRVITENEARMLLGQQLAHDLSQQGLCFAVEALNNRNYLNAKYWELLGDPEIVLLLLRLAAINEGRRLLEEEQLENQAVFCKSMETGKHQVFQPTYGLRQRQEDLNLVNKRLNTVEQLMAQIGNCS